MSTRSMTVLADQARTYPLNLYRHWDGYPAYAGLALAEVLEKSTNATQAASKLLQLLNRDEEGNINKYGSAHPYELADWGPDQQGDLEHVYRAQQTKAGAR